MTGALFFMTVFCGIYGAYMLVRAGFAAITDVIRKVRRSNAGKHR